MSRDNLSTLLFPTLPGAIVKRMQCIQPTVAAAVGWWHSSKAAVRQVVAEREMEEERAGHVGNAGRYCAVRAPNSTRKWRVRTGEFHTTRRLHLPVVTSRRQSAAAGSRFRSTRLQQCLPLCGAGTVIVWTENHTADNDRSGLNRLYIPETKRPTTQSVYTSFDFSSHVTFLRLDTKC